MKRERVSRWYLSLIHVPTSYMSQVFRHFLSSNITFCYTKKPVPNGKFYFSFTYVLSFLCIGDFSVRYFSAWLLHVLTFLDFSKLLGLAENSCLNFPLETWYFCCPFFKVSVLSDKRQRFFRIHVSSIVPCRMEMSQVTAESL